VYGGNSACLYMLGGGRRKRGRGKETLLREKKRVVIISAVIWDDTFLKPNLGKNPKDKPGMGIFHYKKGRVQRVPEEWGRSRAVV